MYYSFGNIQAHEHFNDHASLYCLVGLRHTLASTPWRIHAGWKMLQIQRLFICHERMLICSFHVFASSLEDAAPLETTSPSCREHRFRHPCRDRMDACAIQGSVVVRGEVSVSMCSCCFSSHKQLEASISLEAMSTLGTAQLFRKVVASEMRRAQDMSI